MMSYNYIIIMLERNCSLYTLSTTVAKNRTFQTQSPTSMATTQTLENNKRT